MHVKDNDHTKYACVLLLHSRYRYRERRKEGRTGHACHLSGMPCLTCEDVLIAVLVQVGFGNDAGKTAHPLLHGLVEQMEEQRVIT